MGSAYTGPPWEPGPGEEQCPSKSGYDRCQLPVGHSGGHFVDYGDTVHSWQRPSSVEPLDREQSK